MNIIMHIHHSWGCVSVVWDYTKYSEQSPDKVEVVLKTNEGFQAETEVLCIHSLYY